MTTPEHSRAEKWAKEFYEFLRDTAGISVKTPRDWEDLPQIERNNWTVTMSRLLALHPQIGSEIEKVGRSGVPDDILEHITHYPSAMSLSGWCEVAQELIEVRKLLAAALARSFAPVSQEEKAKFEKSWKLQIKKDMSEQREQPDGFTFAYRQYHFNVVQACVALMGEQVREFFDTECTYFDEFEKKESVEEVAQNQKDSL